MISHKDSYFLRILHILETDEANIYKMLLRYRSRGKIRKMFLPLELRSKPTELLTRLESANADLPEKLAARKALLNRFCDQAKPSGDVMRMTNKSGFPDNNHKQFVLPNETISETEPSIFHEEFFTRQEQYTYVRGTLEGWKRGVSPICKRSSLMTFAISVALTGPILHCFDPDIGISFNFSGPSGTGKTTTMRVGQSVLRRSKSGDIPTLNGTLTAAEELAFQHNDTFFCLDEFGTALGSQKIADETSRFLSYVLCGGVGRRRAKSAASTMGYENLRWRAALITSSEEPLSDLIGTRFPGEEVRLVEINVPSSAENGIFDLFGPEERSNLGTRGLAKDAESAIATNYGTAIRAFIHHFVRDADNCKAMAIKIQDRFVNKMISDGNASEADTRVLEVFGKVAAAAAIAAEAGVLPVTRSEAMKAIRYAFLQTQISKRHIQEKRHSAIGQLKELAVDNKRCLSLSKGQNIPKARFGEIQAIVKNIGGRSAICIVPEYFYQIVGQHLVVPLVAELRTAGILIHRDNSKTRQVMISGLTKDQRPRLYCLDLVRLNEMVE